MFRPASSLRENLKNRVAIQQEMMKTISDITNNYDPQQSEEMNNSIKNLQIELQLRECQNQLDTWKNEYETMKESSMKIITELQSRCQSYEMEIEGFDVICHLAKNENQMMRDRLHATEKMLEENKTFFDMNKTNAQHICHELRTNLELSGKELEKMKSILIEKDNRIYINETALIQKTNSISQLENKLVSTEAQLQNANKVIEDLQFQLATTKAQLEQTNKPNEAIIAQITPMNTHVHTSESYPKHETKDMKPSQDTNITYDYSNKLLYWSNETEPQLEPVTVSAMETEAVIKKPVKVSVIETKTIIKKPVTVSAIETEAVIQEPVIETEAVTQKPVIETEEVIQKPVIETEAVIQKPVIETEAVIQKPARELDTNATQEPITTVLNTEPIESIKNENKMNTSESVK